MKSGPRVECLVDVLSEGQTLGESANAFRVMCDAEGVALLDFCVYSAQDNRARVVARVRITQGFLPLVGVRIQEALQELQQPPGSGNWLTASSNGGVVLLGLSSEEQ